MQTLGWIVGLLAQLVVVIVAGGLGILIIVKASHGSINLSRLISEPNGDASISRFQLLIFTFVIALSLFVIILGQSPPAFPTSIPADLLTLLGISASSYLVSKGIQFTNPAGVARPGLTITPATLTIPAPPNADAPRPPVQQRFTVAPNGAATGAALSGVKWSLVAPAHGRLANETGASVDYIAEDSAPAGPVTLKAEVSGFEDGSAVITYQ